MLRSRTIDGARRGQASISDLVLLPVLGTIVLFAAVRVVYHAYAPQTGPLRNIPKNIRQEVLALRSSDVETRRAAAAKLMLVSMVSGSALAPAVPMLIEALKDEDEDVQESVAVALRNVGPEAVPALAAAMAEFGAEAAFRVAVIKVLGAMGAAAWEAMAALTEATRDPDEGVRRAAATAVMAIVGDRAGARRRR